MGEKFLNVFAIEKSCLSRAIGLAMALFLMFGLLTGHSPSRGTAYASSGWEIETVDSAGDVGSFISLALDESGYPHIIYYDYTNWVLIVPR